MKGCICKLLALQTASYSIVPLKLIFAHTICTSVICGVRDPDYRLYNSCVKVVDGTQVNCISKSNLL